MSKAVWSGVAGIVLSLGAAGCLFDNSQRIERDRQRAEREARAVDAMNRTLTVVGVIYLILFVVAFIGKVKPF